MKKGAGKAKGSGFERDLARYISTWMGSKDKELWVWRSPGSGSVHSVNSLNEDASGDLIALNKNAAPFFDKCSIEAKKGYNGFSFDTIFKDKKCKLREFWRQAKADAKDKYPILIFKKTNCPTWIVINDVLYTKLKEVLRIPFLCFDDQKDTLYIFEINNFFNSFSYEEFLEKL